jgi:lysophospholipid acyltransferase (LPLAT)-like uncharacterized protein
MNALGWLLRILVWLIGLTQRWRMEDPHGVLAKPPEGAYIFAFWHNRIFFLPFLFRKYWHARERKRVAVLVSASKDGEKLSRVLEKFNLVCVRGSSSRRGREALRELQKLVREGHDIGITPDGPRGPKYKVQDGVISLAQLTGATIVPITYLLEWKITLKSWDAFMIPLPFGRCVVRLGKPMFVSREAMEQDRENKKLELETVLKNLSEP